MSAKKKEITIPYHGTVEILMYGGIFYSLSEISKKIQQIGKEKQPMNTKLDRVEFYPNGEKIVGYIFAKDVNISIETISL